MQCVPPFDREFDDGQVYCADQGHPAGGFLALLGIVEAARNHDQAHIDEKQDQDARQPCIPDPPRAPAFDAPERSGNQANRGQGRADGGGGLNIKASQSVFPDQIDQRSDAHGAIAHHRGPCGGDVDIHDAHIFRLLVIRRGGYEREV